MGPEPSEIASILAVPRREAGAMLGEILNARGGVEFSTTRHTSADVVLSAFEAGADLHEGTIDNTPVAAWLAEAMGLSFPGAPPAEVLPRRETGAAMARTPRSRTRVAADFLFA